MITGTITPDDYLIAQRLHRRKAAKLRYLAGVLAILLGLGAWLLSEGTIASVLIGVGIGVLIGEIITRRWLLPHRVRKLHHQQREFAHPVTYSWNSDVIEASSASGHSRRAWTVYHKMRENEDVVLLYHSDNLFEMIPKRWFRDASALDQFVALARNAKQS